MSYKEKYANIADTMLTASVMIDLVTIPESFFDMMAEKAPPEVRREWKQLFDQSHIRNMLKCVAIKKTDLDKTKIDLTETDLQKIEVLMRWIWHNRETVMNEIANFKKEEKQHD